MATIELALPYLRSNEGGFANISGDRGGETYFGIARNKHPEWPGWAILDSLNLPFHIPKACDQIIEADKRILPLVIAFYQKTYWFYDGIVNQRIATKLFDGVVPMEGDGKHGSAVKALQLAVGRQLQGCNPDGNYGPCTEMLVNRCEPTSLLQSLAYFYGKHYSDVLAANPSDEKFREDWMGRALKLPE